VRSVYFPGLNGVRFIAAMLVILDHTELFKFYHGYDTLWPDRYSFHLGAFGVTLFFVLSGFLITYLLLSEKGATGSVDVRQFYIRRILRIWPLYYLLFLVAFFIVPHLDLFQVRFYSVPIRDGGGLAFFLYAFLLANVGFVYRPIPYAGLLWSVAVEEQFYLAWPHIVKRAQRLPLLLFGLILLYVATKLAVPQLAALLGESTEELGALITRTRFSCMMIGALGAFYVFHQHGGVPRFLYSRSIQLVALIAFVALLLDVVRGGALSYVEDELISIVSCVLIINIATNPQTLIDLENRVLNYLGRVSYGLYRSRCKRKE